MQRSLLIATPILVSLLFTGCWVTFGDDCETWPGGDCYGTGGGGGWDTTDCAYWGTCDDGTPQQPGGAVCVPGEMRYCDTPTYCSWGQQACLADGSGWGACVEGSAPPGCGGYVYDPDCCLDSGGCCQDWYDFDGDGDYTDSIGNCEEIPTCTGDDECTDGYCAIEEGDESGLCVHTGSCTTDEDCVAIGPGLGCDDRGVCTPEEEPCPSGECGCTNDDECDDGLMCIASLCTPPDAVCFFDFECSEGSVCLDNECHATCDCDLACPSGQTCQDGLCLEPTVGIDGCVFDEDCADSTGFRCINATCYANCADDEECADGESCRGGACRASTGPEHECASASDCDAGMSCTRGECRLPCAADINCSGDSSSCGPDGFCVNPVELAPECVRSADCSEGQSCQSNACVSR